MSIRGLTPLTLGEAIQSAQQIHSERQATGHNQDALDDSARIGFANGQFEETDDEIPAVLEEFYPTADEMEQAAINHKQAMTTIANKLNQKVMETNT